MRILIGAFFLSALFVAQPAASKPSLMPVPRPAPEWIISEWMNGEGKTLQDLRGKVVIVDFFNSGVRAVTRSPSRFSKNGNTVSLRKSQPGNSR